MNLLIDVGNSRIKWGMGTGDGAIDGPHVLAGDPDRVAAWRALTPRSVIYCSVTDTVATDELVAWIESAWNVRPHRLRSVQHAGGVVNGYDRPETLGDDRWANLLGAHAAWGDRDCVLVDAGTAVTVDGLRADGQHVGGAILPGLATWRTALVTSAPALPATGGQPHLPATSTADGVAAGTLYGLAGAILRLAEGVAGGLHEPRYIVTGGDAGTLMPRLPDDWTHDPLLTLRGLQAEGGSACAG